MNLTAVALATPLGKRGDQLLLLYMLLYYPAISWLTVETMVDLPRMLPHMTSLPGRAYRYTFQVDVW